ncbi:MAG: pilus assembly protein [Candidatus Omnitrophica bacterium]|nr:pilus assembly protein [Candidatus Omnitrophota bacterium]
MNRLCRKHNKKGQATIELAILGSVVIIVLAYLLQQGFIYNAKQSLEMYTFRQSLRLSRMYERGVTLTVIRDVFVPTFFTSLSRQRLMATSSVEYNPWMVYTPNNLTDLSSYRLFQIGDAMIKNDSYFAVPPTKMKIDTVAKAGEWLWTSSMIKDIDPQNFEGLQPRDRGQRTSVSNLTQVSENQQSKTITKSLSSADSIPTIIQFEELPRIVQTQLADNSWVPAGKPDQITGIQIEAGTIPANMKFQLEEVATRSKTTTTVHGNQPN